MVFHAPYDVRLPENDEPDNEIKTVVQPDLLVVCDKSKIDSRGLKGAPDFIIEILSPGSAVKDMKEKLALYEKHGVKEYWVIHPDETVIEVFLLQKNKCYGKPGVYSFSDLVPVAILENHSIDMSEYKSVKVDYEK